MAYNKNKLYKILRLSIQRHAKFYFLEKGVGLVFPPHFVYDFSRKMFLMLHSINWRTFIVWLPLLLQILDNMSITIVYQAVKSWNLKLTLSFLSSRFATRLNSQDKNLNIVRTKKAFEVKQKAFFIIFKGLSVAKNCLRPESVPESVPEVFRQKVFLKISQNSQKSTCTGVSFY